MPGAESRADAMLSCDGWYMSCVGAGAMGVGERRKHSRGLVAESDRSQGA